MVDSSKAQVTLGAQEVLTDCAHALEMLQKESEHQTFRVLWVAAVALARAVGHVLQKTDGRQSTALNTAVEAAYASWTADRSANSIFWQFIEEERNQVLKQYEMGFFAGPVQVVAKGEMFTLDDHLFCPIQGGEFAGETAETSSRMRLSGGSGNSQTFSTLLTRRMAISLNGC